MLQTPAVPAEMPLRHRSAVIFVPRPGSAIDHEIMPGSGIVGVLNGEQWMLFFEGNLYQMENLKQAEDRVICCFGRAAVGYPTVARRGVSPAEHGDLVRVGEIVWPNMITWDSPSAAQIFLDYARRKDPVPAGSEGGLLRNNLLHMDMSTLVGVLEEPRACTEWQWIEAAATFEHRANGIDGRFAFMLRVHGPGCQYESPPPERVAMVIDLAQKMGVSWILFHQN